MKKDYSVLVQGKNGVELILSGVDLLEIRLALLLKSAEYNDKPEFKEMGLDYYALAERIKDFENEVCQ